MGKEGLPIFEVYTVSGDGAEKPKEKQQCLSSIKSRELMTNESQAREGCIALVIISN